jgi:bacillithiol synthase
MNIPVDKLPGLHPVTLAYLKGDSRVTSFFAGNYQNDNHFKSIADEVIKSDHAHRADLCNILMSQNSLYHCGHNTIENIKKLSHADTLVVATGQQVGLFSGPLYTIYKAATVIRLAEELTKRFKINVVPIFYLVAEDHDFAEVQWFGIIDAANNFRKIIYRPVQEINRLPVCQIMIDQNIEIVFDQLNDSIPHTEFSDDIIQNLRQAYSQNHFFHQAFAMWFTRIFSKYGIILFDASDARIKPMINSVLEREVIDNLCTLSVGQTNQHLLQLGFTPQIELIPERPQVAILKDGRHSLQRNGKNFINLHNGDILTSEKLLSHPEHLSPKAVLRPLVQDFLFPTVAYVAGPAEIAYWAQLKRAYQAFNITMPIVVPRSGFTLVENKIKKYMQRYGISPIEFIMDSKAILQKIHREQIPDEIRVILEELYLKMDTSWHALHRATLKIDPKLENGIEKTKNNCLHYIKLMEKTIINAEQQKNEIRSRQLNAVNDYLVPKGILQERQINIVNFLLRHHWAVVERVMTAARPFNFEHKILELEND